MFILNVIERVFVPAAPMAAGPVSLALAMTLVLTGCPDPVGNKLTAGPEALTAPVGAGPKSSRRDTRFIKIRDLLRKGSDDPRRATELYSLVHPVCVDPAERTDFLAVARWSASYSKGDDRRTAILVIDTLEYVATACFRTDAEGTLALIDGVEAFLPDEPRLAILRARLHATAGQLEAALAAAAAAERSGSVHALALKANIQARIARSAGVGYRRGMLDAAITTVSAAPQAHWRAIDLTAILSTKARLLWERATWEEGPAAARSLEAADKLFERLSIPPFLMQTRLRALDNLCFDAMALGQGPEACRRAALEGQVLGAAAVAQFPPDPARFDEDRRARILKARQTWTSLPKGAAVALVARGDEAELLEWTRPAARLLRAVLRPDLRLILIDRTREKRAGALLDRLVALVGHRPAEVLRVGRDPLAMPCITAVVAQRQAPASCPLAAEVVQRLETMTPFGAAVLVGRDLDAELDDLALYDLDATLLSFRLSRLKKPVHAWLKSVSDVFLMAP